MANEQKFHVRCGHKGIFAGVLIKDNCLAWQECSEVTLEALCAVRDHMLSIIPEGNKSVSFYWLDDKKDKALTLTLVVDSDTGSKLTV